MTFARLRRLRSSSVLRDMVREHHLQVNDLIYPMFVIYGHNIKNPISSMPGVYQLSVDRLLQEVSQVVDLGIPAVILFG
ncbi:MAG TPA: porphobilinogen synthase, partial [Clostridia bacterium]|nr:porphobilinogen synthase [Clostridia bacterium]